MNDTTKREMQEVIKRISRDFKELTEKLTKPGLSDNFIKTADRSITYDYIKINKLAKQQKSIEEV
jgi:mRNA-degrading endonuclease YafQ of YafQ-DinJ toxin-antitoxin module